MNTLRQRLILIAMLIVGVLAVGTVGYVWIDDYPVFDAFYMAIITITTVGYSEIHPLSDAGRLFNSFLLLFGVGIMFFAVGAITQSVVETQFSDELQKRRVRKMIEKLQNHYILCGFGRVGRGAAVELRRTGVPFVVIDRDEDKVERAIRSEMVAVHADSSHDDVLVEVGIHRARGLIACLSTDADNLFLILSAKSLNPTLTVASRVAEEGSESKMRFAGADAVFTPYAMTGYRLAQSILRPHVFEFLDITSSSSSMGLNVGIEQIEVPNGSPLAGKSLRDLQLRREHGVIVLAIRRATGTMEFNPAAETGLQGGDHLIVMGSVSDVELLARMVSGVRA